MANPGNGLLNCLGVPCSGSRGGAVSHQSPSSFSRRYCQLILSRTAPRQQPLQCRHSNWTTWWRLSPSIPIRWWRRYWLLPPTPWRSPKPNNGCATIPTGSLAKLMDKAKKQNWDPSVQGLVAFPDVLAHLTQDMNWTTQLGNAFLAQQADVMQAVQRMRAEAEAKGTLRPLPRRRSPLKIRWAAGDQHRAGEPGRVVRAELQSRIRMGATRRGEPTLRSSTPASMQVLGGIPE